MQQIVPAIIPASRRHLDVMLEKVTSFSDEVQVDIVDGVFDDSRSWPYTMAGSLGDSLSGVRFDTLRVGLDLMIMEPEHVLDQWLSTRPARMIVHVESAQDLPRVLAHAGQHGYQLGLAFSNDTDLALLDTLDRACVDFIQLMGIAEIGEQGNAFDERVLARIRTVKETYPSLPVRIDGSVNQDTLPRLREAGADSFVVGSALWKSEDPAHTFKELLMLAA